MVLVLPCKVNLAGTIPDHISMTPVDQVHASHREELRVKAHVANNGCGMKIELEIVASSGPRSTTRKLMLQSAADCRYFGCGLQELPQRVDQTVKARATPHG